MNPWWRRLLPGGWRPDPKHFPLTIPDALVDPMERQAMRKQVNGLSDGARMEFLIAYWSFDEAKNPLQRFQQLRSIIDTFVRAAQKAGPNLTTESFIKAMDTMTIPPDMFGSAEATYTATKRLGSDASRLSQIQDGKWKVVGPYITDAVAAKK